MFRVLKALLVTTLLVFFTGCGGGGGGGGSASAPGSSAAQATPLPPSVATLVLKSVLAREVPGQVTTFRLTGFDLAGLVRYGPVSKAKATIVEFENVPTEVRRVQIEYLAGQSLVGIARVDCNLVAGQRFEFDNINFDDVQAQLTSLSLEPTTLSFAAGTSAPLKAVGHYSDGVVLDLSRSVSWQSSDGRLTVSSAGLVGSNTPGDYTVTARYGATTATGEVKVTAAVLDSIRFEPALLDLPRGTNASFEVVALFSDGTQQTVTGLAEISVEPGSLGSLQGTSSFFAGTVGTGSLKASYKGQAAECQVNVSAATLNSLEVQPATLSLAKGTQSVLVALGTFSDQTQKNITADVLWSSSDPHVCGVGPDGTVVAYSEGEADITASKGQIQAQSHITVTPATLESLTLSPDANLPLGLAQQLILLAHYSDGTTVDVTQQASYTSANPSIASVTSIGTRGTVTALAVGTTSIEADFGSKTAQVTISALPALFKELLISPNTFSLPVGLSQALVAQAKYSDGTTRVVTDQVMWKSLGSSLAEVDSSGSVLGLSIGQTKIEGLFSGATIQVDVQVVSPVPISLRVTPHTRNLTPGSSFEFGAIARYSDGSESNATDSVNWSTTDSLIATIDTTGKLLAQEQGTCDVKAQLDQVVGTAALKVVAPGTGEGFFPPIVFANGGSSVDIGDIDGDGDIDAVCGSANNSYVEVLLNTGTGLLNDVHRIELASNRRIGLVATANLDKDKDQDVVFTETTQRQVWVALHTTGGNFTLLSPLSVRDGGYPTGLFLLDIDQDGDTDILIENYSGSSYGMDVYYNNGDAGFSAGTPLPLGSGNSSPIEVRDFDKTNGPDIFWQDRNTNLYQISYNQGDGTFAAPVTVFSNTYYQGMSLADFNKDGKLDIAYVFNGSGYDSVRILLGDGAGGFTQVSEYRVGDTATSTYFSDLNKDGKLDLLVNSSQGNGLFLLWGLGDGRFEEPVEMTEGPSNLHFADLDKDGSLDIIGSGVTCYYNRGNFARNSIIRTGYKASEHVPVDFDGDGDLDIAVITDEAPYPGYPGDLYRNNGNGSFTKSGTFRSCSHPSGLIVADLTGDKIPDLALVSRSGSTKAIFVAVGDGNGGFPQTYTYQTANPPVQIVAVDVDGDKDLDLVGLDAARTGVRVYPNDGTGRFLTESPLYPGGETVQNIASFDVDGDKDSDVVTVSAGDYRIKVLKNDGNGVFAAPLSMDTGQPAPSQFSYGDIDGDKDIDLAVFHGNFPREIVTMVNDGTGVFTPSQRFTETGSSGVRLIDLNDDGDADLITDGIRLSDGAGNFGEKFTGPIRRNSTRLTAADYDGDGDIDLCWEGTIYTFYDALYFYWNEPFPGH